MQPKVLVTRPGGDERKPGHHEHEVELEHMSRKSIRWRAVLGVLAAFLQQGMSWGLLMVYGSQFQYFQDTLFIGRSRVALAAPGALAAGIVLMFSVIQGRLCDDHWHRSTNVVGSVLFIGGLIFLALGSGEGRRGNGNYTNVMISYALQGAGQSTFFVTSSHIAASWFPESPGLPIGISSCGVAVAGIIWPLLFTRGTAAWGFRPAVGAMAGFATLCCVLICVFGVPDPSQRRRPVKPVFKIRTWVDPKALKDPEWCLTTASMCFIYLALLGLPQFLETWAESRHIVRLDTSAVILLTVATGSSLAGRLGGSFLGNRYGFRLIHAVCNFLEMIVVFASWFTARRWSHGIAFAVLFGILQGAIIALPPADMKEVVDPQNGRKRAENSPIRASGMTTAVNSRTSIDRVTKSSLSPLSPVSPHPSLHKAQSDDSISPPDHIGLGEMQLTTAGNEGIASLAGDVARTGGEDEAERDHAALVSERRAKLGGWLGSSFLCAAPFAVAGPLATSQLVGQFGIASAGWWTGACYGASGICLLLSLLATRQKNRRSRAVMTEKV